VECWSANRLRIYGSKDEIHIRRPNLVLPGGTGQRNGWNWRRCQRASDAPVRLPLESELQLSPNAPARLSAVRPLATLVNKEKKEKSVPPTREPRAVLAVPNLLAVGTTAETQSQRASPTTRYH
jgi:hypothetical protein